MEKQQGMTFIEGVMMEQIFPRRLYHNLKLLFVIDMVWYPSNCGNAYSIMHVMTIHTPSICLLHLYFGVPLSNERLRGKAKNTPLMSSDCACKIWSDHTINHILVGLFETFVLWAPQPVKWLEVQLRWHDNPRCLIQSNRYIFQKQHCLYWK